MKTGNEGNHLVAAQREKKSGKLQRDYHAEFLLINLTLGIFMKPWAFLYLLWDRVL